MSHPRSQAQKGDAFFALHHRGKPFVIPNPWDIGSAKIMAAKGFEALATTSVGVDHMLGKPSGTSGREEILANARMIAAATDLPVSVDMEDCYGDTPEAIRQSIHMVAETGAVGCSIEDMRFGGDHEIYPFDEAVKRVEAAVAAARELPFKFTLTARCENFLCGRPDMANTIKRLQAFESAGADVLYAPGPNSIEQIAELKLALKTPINVLLGLPGTTLTMADMEKLGIARISLGSALHRAAMSAALSAIDEITTDGSFSFTKDCVPATVMDKLLG